MRIKEHIFYCTKLNNTEIRVEYENIYQENINNMITILNRFKENMNKREMYSHVIQKCDPPVLVLSKLSTFH